MGWILVEWSNSGIDSSILKTGAEKAVEIA